jgi:hypothetical protein
MEIVSIQQKFKAFIKNDPQLKKIYSKDLIDYLFMRPIYSIESLLQSLPQIETRQTASKYLQLLKEK